MAELAEHRIMVLPIFTRFKGGELVTCKTKYLQLQCRKHKKRIRAYCKFSPVVIQ